MGNGSDIGDGEWRPIDDDGHVPAPLVTIETRATSLPRGDAANLNPPIPRARSAAYRVENPGFAAPPIPRADSAACGVENPGFAASESFGEAARFPLPEADPHLQ